MQDARRLHPDICCNEKCSCLCGENSLSYGIHHDIFEGEPKFPKCDPATSNEDRLFQYSIKISPDFKIEHSRTVINYLGNDYIFAGFTLLSHYKITNVSPKKVVKGSVEYEIALIEDDTKIVYTVNELEIFDEFLFTRLLEMLDLNDKISENDCRQFHLIPNFVTYNNEDGVDNWTMLPMCEVLAHLMRACIPLDQYSLLHPEDECRGALVVNPSKRPYCIRCDLLDASTTTENAHGDTDERNRNYPTIVHQGQKKVTNQNLSQKRRVAKRLKTSMKSLSEPSAEDKEVLLRAERDARNAVGGGIRHFAAELCAAGFYATGLNNDVALYALFTQVLIRHLRFYKSLEHLQERIEYKFKDISYLVMAVTHSSYQDSHGTNAEHFKNTMMNCGPRWMQRFVKQEYYEKNNNAATNPNSSGHNERLEFLGDSVLKLCATEHLFRMFPEMDEGDLTVRKIALVENANLIARAQKFDLHKYMRVLHKAEVCEDMDCKKLMADCMEALIGAVYLDGGFQEADKLIDRVLWDEPKLHKVWNDMNEVPLQIEEPLGDRHLIERYDVLEKLVPFEDSIGVEFKHIRLLGQALTDGSLKHNNVTQDSGERLELLGDAVLELVISEKLYRKYPNYDEGRLSTLRSSLVNNDRLAVVYENINMQPYLLSALVDYAPTTNKRRADFVESLIGAIYLDKGMKHCEKFIEVTVTPNLDDMLRSGDWQDPKNKLLEKCVALRKLGTTQPEYPIYRVRQAKGSSQNRTYKVSVYFRGQRVGTGTASTISRAELVAAEHALTANKGPFAKAEKPIPPKLYSAAVNKKTVVDWKKLPFGNMSATCSAGKYKKTPSVNETESFIEPSSDEVFQFGWEFENRNENTGKINEEILAKCREVFSTLKAPNNIFIRGPPINETVVESQNVPKCDDTEVSSISEESEAVKNETCSEEIDLPEVNNREDENETCSEEIDLPEVNNHEDENLNVNDKNNTQCEDEGDSEEDNSIDEAGPRVTSLLEDMLRLRQQMIDNNKYDQLMKNNDDF